MSNPASRVNLAVPFAQKDEAKRLGAKWDVAKRTWYAPSGEQALVDRWGGPPRKRQKNSCDAYDTYWPGPTVESVRNGPNGKEIVIKVDREPWDPPEL